MPPRSHARPASAEAGPAAAARRRPWVRRPGSAQDPSGDAGRGTDPVDAAAARRRTLWRVGTPLVALCSGALFVVSAESSEGTDLRPGRYTDLASLVGSEAKQYDALQERVSELTDQVNRLTAGVDERDVNRYRAEVARLRDPAGLEPRTGPGLRVTLSDAPFEVIDSSAQDPELMIVHQQDIQAVVNALWRGGATAVTIQGQRVISTTGIKCFGNAILLQGRPYPQPYVIEAVGDPAAMFGSLSTDEFVTTYREQSEIPDVAVGWELETLAQVKAPAYDGLLDVSYAEPLT